MLEALAVQPQFIDKELGKMSEYQLATTTSRSVLGVMNQFVRMSNHYDSPTDDLQALALWLAETPCGPLYGRNISPDRETVALAKKFAG